MQIHLTAAGTPAEIMATLNRDIARERASNSESAGALIAVRDDIAKQIGAGETLEGSQAPKHYTVSARVEIRVDEQANADDAERARKALVGGQPFTPSGNVGASRPATDAEIAQLSGSTIGAGVSAASASPVSTLAARRASDRSAEK